MNIKYKLKEEEKNENCPSVNDTMNKNYQTKFDRNKERKKNMGRICWPNTGRGESRIPGALHCRSSTCLTIGFILSSSHTFTSTSSYCHFKIKESYGPSAYASEILPKKNLKY